MRRRGLGKDSRRFLAFGNRLSDCWAKPLSNRYGGKSSSTASKVTVVEDSIRIGPCGPSSSTTVCWLCRWIFRRFDLGWSGRGGHASPSSSKSSLDILVPSGERRTSTRGSRRAQWRQIGPQIWVAAPLSWHGRRVEFARGDAPRRQIDRPQEDACARELEFGLLRSRSATSRHQQRRQPFVPLDQR